MLPVKLQSCGMSTLTELHRTYGLVHCLLANIMSCSLHERGSAMKAEYELLVPPKLLMELCCLTLS